MPTTSQGVNPNANIPVDPLQTQDPWRIFQTPSQEAGIPDRPFPVSMPTSPDRQQPFGATSSNAQAASPPPPGLPRLFGGGPSYASIHTPAGSQQGQGNQHEENPFKGSERWSSRDYWFH